MITTTKRYAAVETHSGYIWGVADASRPEDALRAICTNADSSEPKRDLHSSTPCEVSAHGGFQVFEVDADYEVDDGQNEDEIANLVEVGVKPTYWISYWAPI